MSALLRFLTLSRGTNLSTRSRDVEFWPHYRFGHYPYVQKAHKMRDRGPLDSPNRGSRRGVKPPSRGGDGGTPHPPLFYPGGPPRGPPQGGEKYPTFPTPGSIFPDPLFKNERPFFTPPRGSGSPPIIYSFCISVTKLKTFVCVQGG